MSGTITLTAAMRANLLSLQQTGTQLSTTQLDLATGNKVNSALDNPVNFFAAQSLNQRASALSALLDGMGQGIQTIQAANQGLTSITTLVNQLTSVANTAKTDLAKETSQDVLETAGQSGLNSATVNDLMTGGGSIAPGDTFTLQNGSSPAASFTINTTTAGGVGTTLQDLVNAINAVQGFSASIVYGDGATVSAGDDHATTVGDAYLKVVSTTDQAITATQVGSGTSLATLGLDWIATPVAGPPASTTYAASTTGTGISNAITTGGDSADEASYAAVIQQIDATAANSNYQGNNLIDGTGSPLTVQVNELSTTPITVSSVDATHTGLGLSTQANWSSTTAINETIAQVNNALSTLQTQASGFANSLSLLQTRQDFTTNLVNTLQDGASQLTIADKNEEGANLLALQTQQQLGIEALSLSSQANQSVLRLFA